MTVTTADTPHRLPTLAQLPGLVGGNYQVERPITGPSFVNLTLAPRTACTTPCGAICS